MNIEEAKLYLEHTSKDDFNLEEWQKENRYQAIQVVLKEIERLNNLLQQKENIIKEVREYIEKLRNLKIKYVMFDEEKELYASENNFVKELLEILKGSDKK